MKSKKLLCVLLAGTMLAATGVSALADTYVCNSIPENYVFCDTQFANAEFGNEMMTVEGAYLFHDGDLKLSKGGIVTLDLEKYGKAVNHGTVEVSFVWQPSIEANGSTGAVQRFEFGDGFSVDAVWQATNTASFQNFAFYNNGTKLTDGKEYVKEDNPHRLRLRKESIILTRRLISIQKRLILQLMSS